MRLAGGLLLLLASAAAAQSPGDAEIPPVNFPTIAKESAVLEGFVPKQWKLEASARGDLNGDKVQDAAIVLRMTDPANLLPSDWDPNQKYDSNPRMLVVALGKPGGGYELAAADHELIPRLENQNQEDPFDAVAIRNGTLRVEMHIFMSAGGWWMGNVAYTFRWQDGDFKLVGHDRNGVTRNTGETDTISINYLTGKKVTKTGSIENDVEKAKSQSIPKKPLLTLSQVGDGLMFYPDEH